MMPLPDEDQDPICDECDESDSRYNQKVMGMEIMKGARKDGAQYTDGKILDPENGKIYNCRIK